MAKIHKYLLNLLFLFLAIILLSPILMSMNFPIELEARESTLWLHILTIKEGINIYDQKLVAYANQAHGPLDPIFKLFIHKILFFLEPWQVSRLNNLMLFLSIFLINFLVFKKEHTIKLSLFISLTIYSLVYLLTKTFQGRADITAMLFISYLSYLCCDKNYYKKNINLIFASFIFSLIIMTNWRFLPLCLAISLFPIIDSGNIKNIFSKHKIFIVIKFFLYSVIPFFLILYLFFNLELKKYFDYFIGFFYFGESFFTLEHFNQGLRHVIRVEKIYFLIFLIFLYLLKFYKKEQINFSYFLKILITVLVFLSSLVSYLYNYVGGGIYYFTPLIFFLWFQILYEQKNDHFSLNFKGKINILIIAISLIIILVSTKNSIRSYNFLKAGHKDSIILHEYLTELNLKNKNVLSESLHFHKKNYSGEKIDIGDLISYRAFQVGGEYEKTYLSHLKDLKDLKFDYIVHNFTGSQIINELIKSNQYKIVKKFDKNVSNIGEILILEKVN